MEKYHDIHVVYTKEAETADAYIERATYEIGRRHRVRVATSDGPEQLIILGHGALRLSASAFRQEVEQVEARSRTSWPPTTAGRRPETSAPPWSGPRDRQRRRSHDRIELYRRRGAGPLRPGPRNLERKGLPQKELDGGRVRIEPRYNQAPASALSR